MSPFSSSPSEASRVAPPDALDSRPEASRQPSPEDQGPGSGWRNVDWKAAPAGAPRVVGPRPQGEGGGGPPRAAGDACIQWTEDDRGAPTGPRPPSTPGPPAVRPGPPRDAHPLGPGRAASRRVSASGLLSCRGSSVAASCGVGEGPPERARYRDVSPRAPGADRPSSLHRGVRPRRLTPLRGRPAPRPSLGGGREGWLLRGRIGIGRDGSRGAATLPPPGLRQCPPGEAGRPPRSRADMSQGVLHGRRGRRFRTASTFCIPVFFA